LQGHTGILTSLCFSSKTNRLISASYDHTIRVWDTTTNTCIHTVTDTDRGSAVCLVLSDDGDTLYSGEGPSNIGAAIVCFFVNMACTINAWRIDHTWT
jgi:WD40 repeat protein